MPNDEDKKKEKKSNPNLPDEDKAVLIINTILEFARAVVGDEVGILVAVVYDKNSVILATGGGCPACIVEDTYRGIMRGEVQHESGRSVFQSEESFSSEDKDKEETRH